MRNLTREIRRLGGKVSPATRIASPVGTAVGRTLRALGGEEFHAAWAQEMIVQARHPSERDRFPRV
ncbi:MAG: hypothetical protein H5U04_12835 [Firmicutes bacterium]|nr:hypothetical protein [Bacillota bacterium]